MDANRSLPASADTNGSKTGILKRIRKFFQGFALRCRRGDARDIRKQNRNGGHIPETDDGEEETGISQQNEDEHDETHRMHRFEKDENQNRAYLVFSERTVSASQGNVPLPSPHQNPTERRQSRKRKIPHNSSRNNDVLLSPRVPSRTKNIPEQDTVQDEKFARQLYNEDTTRTKQSPSHIDSFSQATHTITSSNVSQPCNTTSAKLGEITFSRVHAIVSSQSKGIQELARHVAECAVRTSQARQARTCELALPPSTNDRPSYSWLARTDNTLDYSCNESRHFPTSVSGLDQQPFSKEGFQHDSSRTGGVKDELQMRNKSEVSSFLPLSMKSDSELPVHMYTEKLSRDRHKRTLNFSRNCRPKENDDLKHNDPEIQQPFQERCFQNHDTECVTITSCRQTQGTQDKFDGTEEHLHPLLEMGACGEQVERSELLKGRNSKCHKLLNYERNNELHCGVNELTAVEQDFFVGQTEMCHAKDEQGKAGKQQIVNDCDHTAGQGHNQGKDYDPTEMVNGKQTIASYHGESPILNNEKTVSANSGNGLSRKSEDTLSEYEHDALHFDDGTEPRTDELPSVKADGLTIPHTTSRIQAVLIEGESWMKENDEKALKISEQLRVNKQTHDQSRPFQHRGSVDLKEHEMCWRSVEDEMPKNPITKDRNSEPPGNTGDHNVRGVAKNIIFLNENVVQTYVANIADEYSVPKPCPSGETKANDNGTLAVKELAITNNGFTEKRCDNGGVKEGTASVWETCSMKEQGHKTGNVIAICDDAELSKQREIMNNERTTSHISNKPLCNRPKIQLEHRSTTFQQIMEHEPVLEPIKVRMDSEEYSSQQNGNIVIVNTADKHEYNDETMERQKDVPNGSSTIQVDESKVTGSDWSRRDNPGDTDIYAVPKGPLTTNDKSESASEEKRIIVDNTTAIEGNVVTGEYARSALDTHELIVDDIDNNYPELFQQKENFVGQQGHNSTEVGHFTDVNLHDMTSETALENTHNGTRGLASNQTSDANQSPMNIEAEPSQDNTDYKHHNLKPNDNSKFFIDKDFVNAKNDVADLTVQTASDIIHKKTGVHLVHDGEACTGTSCNSGQESVTHEKPIIEQCHTRTQHDNIAAATEKKLEQEQDINENPMKLLVDSFHDQTTIDSDFSDDEKEDFCYQSEPEQDSVMGETKQSSPKNNGTATPETNTAYKEVVLLKKRSRQVSPLMVNIALSGTDAHSISVAKETTENPKGPNGKTDDVALKEPRDSIKEPNTSSIPSVQATHGQPGNDLERRVIIKYTKHPYPPDGRPLSASLGSFRFRQLQGVNGPLKRTQSSMDLRRKGNLNDRETDNEQSIGGQGYWNGMRAVQNGGKYRNAQSKQPSKDGLWLRVGNESSDIGRKCPAVAKRIMDKRETATPHRLQFNSYLSADHVNPKSGVASNELSMDGGGLEKETLRVGQNIIGQEISKSDVDRQILASNGTTNIHKGGGFLAEIHPSSYDKERRETVNGETEIKSKERSDTREDDSGSQYITAKSMNIQFDGTFPAVNTVGLSPTEIAFAEKIASAGRRTKQLLRTEMVKCPRIVAATNQRESDRNERENGRQSHFGINTPRQESQQNEHENGVSKTSSDTIHQASAHPVIRDAAKLNMPMKDISGSLASSDFFQKAMRERRAILPSRFRGNIQNTSKPTLGIADMYGASPYHMRGQRPVQIGWESSSEKMCSENMNKSNVLTCVDSARVSPCPKMFQERAMSKRGTISPCKVQRDVPSITAPSENPNGECLGTDRGTLSSNSGSSIYPRINSGTTNLTSSSEFESDSMQPEVTDREYGFIDTQSSPETIGNHGNVASEMGFGHASMDTDSELGIPPLYNEDDVPTRNMSGSPASSTFFQKAMHERRAIFPSRLMSKYHNSETGIGPPVLDPSTTVTCLIPTRQSSELWVRNSFEITTSAEGNGGEKVIMKGKIHNEPIESDLSQSDGNSETTNTTTSAGPIRQGSPDASSTVEQEHSAHKQIQFSAPMPRDELVPSPFPVNKSRLPTVSVPIKETVVPPKRSPRLVTPSRQLTVEVGDDINEADKIKPIIRKSPMEPIPTVSKKIKDLRFRQKLILTGRIHQKSEENLKFFKQFSKAMGGFHNDRARIVQ